MNIKLTSTEASHLHSLMQILPLLASPTITFEGKQKLAQDAIEDEVLQCVAQKLSLQLSEAKPEAEIDLAEMLDPLIDENRVAIAADAIDRQLPSIENTEDVQAWVNRLTNSPIEAKLAAVMGELFNIAMFDLSSSDRVRQEPETRISLNIGWACDDMAIELEEAASDWTESKRYEFAIAMLELLKGGDRPVPVPQGQQSEVEKLDRQSDLEFLLEMKTRLADGVDRRDPTQIQFVQKMINDWISELKGTIRLP